MRLLLLRHAKSSWDDPTLEDEERPLAPRGERAADRLRDYIEAEGIRPSLVLCSAARRARETVAGVLPALGRRVELRIDPALYTFDAAHLLEVLRALPADVQDVMIVGHNPAIQELAVRLAGRGERLGKLSERYPTGALAEIELSSTSWRDLGEATGELTRFVAPRELG